MNPTLESWAEEQRFWLEPFGLDLFVNEPPERLHWELPAHLRGMLEQAHPRSYHVLVLWHSRTRSYHTAQLQRGSEPALRILDIQVESMVCSFIKHFKHRKTTA